jgi:glycosyltransferase involved in cell wall biosynthesis
MIDVLVDMTTLNTGNRERGIGRYVRSLCHEFASRNAWLHEFPGLPGAQLELAGLVRHRGASAGAADSTLTFAGDPSLETSGLGDQRHKLERRLFMGGLLQRVQCRLAHLPDPPGTPFDRRQRRIVTCHDLIPLVLAAEYLSPLPGARLLQRERDKARYKTAARVIAISHATRRDLIEQLEVSPERIDVVHHGVDHERFRPEAAPNELGELRESLAISSPFLLYLGAGDARKNLPLLIRAYARSGVAADVALVLAGPLSARIKARLEAEAATAGVAERVHLLGYVDEAHIPALYRQCLAHVFPSSYEGFGLTVLEAMACGAPTLTTAFSSLGEVAGEAALTLRELSEEPFARELERLVSDGALRADLRRRGLAHASGFTWRRCAAETLACYQRALDEAKA